MAPLLHPPCYKIDQILFDMPVVSINSRHVFHRIICTGLISAPVSESNVTMTSHLDNQHQEDSLELASMNKLQSISTFYSCAMCKTIFPSYDELYKHLAMEHGILGAVSCETCQNIFLNTAELKHHFETNHKDSSPITIAICVTTYTRI